MAKISSEPSPKRIAKFLEIVHGVPPSLAGLEHAYAVALSLQELLSALEQSLRDAHARHVILNAVDGKAGTPEFEEAVTNFAKSLVRLPRATFRVVQAQNLVLDRLFPLVSHDTQAAIMACWLNCEYADSRKRSLKWMQRSAEFGGPDQILAYWKSTGEEAAAKHLIYDTPLDWLEKNAAELLLADLPSWLLSRLLLRLSEHNPRAIEKARSRDPITYLYLSAKTNQPVSNEDALNLFDAAKTDLARRGLALWAIGRMGLWTTLDSIAARSEELSELDVRTILDSGREKF